MHRIIVNADDFGVNQAVNREIERMIVEGAISSTTIMANGACLEEACSFAKTHPTVSYGVHLCLSEFDSITKSPILQKYGVTDKNGRFIRMAIFHLSKFPAELLCAIKEELLAQIRMIESYYLPLSHCDSHHHVHTIWGLQNVFDEVLREEGFTKIRIAWHESTYNKLRHPIRSIKRELIIRFYKKRFKTTDAFYSYADYMGVAIKDPHREVELMCHPGHPKYTTEYESVQHKKALAGGGISLITYNDL